jgi:hypothetical protein
MDGLPLGGQPATFSKRDWIDQQHILVNQIPANQRPDQFPATRDARICAILSLKSGDRMDGVTLQQRRVLPGERLLERPRGHVFPHLVEVSGKGNARANGKKMQNRIKETTPLGGLDGEVGNHHIQLTR